MQSAVRERRSPSSRLMPTSAWAIGSVLLLCMALFVAATFGFHQAELGGGLLIISLSAFCLVAAFHARFLYRARELFRRTSGTLQEREREFQAIFENALDGILILDDGAICRDVNPSGVELLGVRREQLLGQALSIFYPDRRRFDLFWERLLMQKRDHGQSEIVRADGAQIVVEFAATADFFPKRHMIVFRDITPRHEAEEARARSLAIAKSAWEEADALRKATLALTRDLRLDHVLDTLLETLRLLVPYDAAQVLLLEAGSRLFLAREASPGADPDRSSEFPRTLDASQCPTLRKALESRAGAFVSDTLDRNDWRDIYAGSAVRSWLGVPLRSANQVIGLLSVAHSVPGQFTAEHLRVTNSLAIPASVAIQNARLYERAEIYGAELERRLADLRRTKQALDVSEESRMAGEDRYEKLFRSTPIAFCVTSLANGRFIDVNAAFERRFGYARTELIGLTSTELGFWEDPQERSCLIERLGRGARIRGEVARFRAKSGEFKASLYSAETIQLDGQQCLLVVSEDLP